MKKKKNNNQNISNKEKEILSSYDEMNDDIEEFEVTEDFVENIDDISLPEENTRKNKKTKKQKIKKEKPKKSKEEEKEAELFDSILEEYEIDEATSYDEEIKEEQNKKHKKEKKEKIKEPKEKKEKVSKSKKDKNKKLEKEEIEEFEISDDLVEEYDEINNDVEEEYEFVEEEVAEKKETKKKKNKITIIINILFGIVMLLIILSVLDIVSVVKYENKPHFAIPVKTYDDGGSKEYLGLGYKVIKYNQVQGRRDIEIGTWSLKYSIDPIYLDTIDLAIEATDNERATYEKYYKKFLRITGILNKVDIQENVITVSYIDEGKKYNFDVICNMATSQDVLTTLEVNNEVTVIGTMIDYKFKSNKNNSSIILENCFAEQ